jgi:hypothetical protein
MAEDVELKKHFEANMLDGDEIQDGQMLSSASVFEYLTEVIAEREQAARADEIKESVVSWGSFMPDRTYMSNGDKFYAVGFTDTQDRLFELTKQTYNGGAKL